MYEASKHSISSSSMLVYGLYTERYVGSSTVLGANLCWIKDLIAALTEKEMEAQRAEVTWPR